jgi:hypothetical protein
MLSVECQKQVPNREAFGACEAFIYARPLYNRVATARIRRHENGYNLGLIY